MVIAVSRVHDRRCASLREAHAVGRSQPILVYSFPSNARGCGYRGPAASTNSPFGALPSSCRFILSGDERLLDLGIDRTVSFHPFPVHQSKARSCEVTRRMRWTNLQGEKEIRTEGAMLTETPIVPYIPAKDMARARKFYEEKIGLKPKQEYAGGVIY